MFVYLLKLTDRTDLTYGLYMFLTQFCGLIKFVVFVINNGKFQLMFQRSKTFQLESEFEEKLFKQHMNLFSKITIFYYLMAMIAIHATELMAIFANTVKLPFSAWYPVLDWEHNIRDYWIAVIYQHISITSASLLIISIDVLFSFLLFIISIELELIGNRMSKVGYFHDKNIESRLEYRTKQMNIVKNCIEFHQSAVEFKCNLERSFTVPFFVQIVASGIVISSIIYEVAHVNKNTSLILPNVDQYIIRSF